MARILVLFATLEGQTRKISDAIADQLRSDGLQVVERDVTQLPDDLPLDGFDGVVLGGSIHVGKVQRSLRRWVRHHHAQLDAMPNAFFMVCLTAASKRPEAADEVEQMMQAFVKDTGWTPARAAAFGGALKYSQYGFIKKMVMVAIAKAEGGDTDTSHDYEYTRWDSVAAFTEDFARALPQAA